MDNELMNYPRESSSYSVTVYALGGRKEKRKVLRLLLKEESVVVF